MSTIINGTSSAITFPDTTVQNTAFTTSAVTQSTIGTNVAGTGPAFSATLSGTQSVTSATFTKAALASEIYDTNSNFDSSTYRFTPTVAGYYLIVANGLAQLASGTGTIALTQIRKNLGTVAQMEATTTFANGLSLPVSTIQYMNGSTDYIELYLYNNGASSPSFGAGQENTSLMGCLIRAA